MRRVLTLLLAVALVTAVANQALAFRVSNVVTGEIYFLEDGWENDTVFTSPDNPEVGTVDASSDTNLPSGGGAGVVNNILHPQDPGVPSKGAGPGYSGIGSALGAPGPKFGRNYYVKGQNTDTGMATTLFNFANPAPEGSIIDVEWFLFLRNEENGGGNGTNSFPWHMNLLNSNGDIVAGVANGWTPARSVASTTNLTINPAGGGGAADGEVGEVFDDGEWVKFTLRTTITKELVDPANTPNMKLFIKSDRIGSVGPLSMFTPTNVSGDAVAVRLGNDDRANSWYMDWPEPGTLSLLSLGGLLMMRRRRRA